jgi:hypothetical protein
MAIPTGGLLSEIDFLNPACFTNGGTAVYDLTVNGNDWTLDSTSYTYDPTFGTLTLPTTTNLIADSYFYTGNVPFTISYWMYYDSTTPDEHQFYNGCYSASGWLTFHTLTGTTQFRFVVNGGAADAASGSLVDNAYNNITAIYDGTNFYGYVNNVLKVTVPGVINQQRGPYPSFAFNDPGVNTGLKGLGLVNFYDNALNSTNRNQLYNDGLNRFFPPPVPIAEYDFQNGSYPGSGTTVFDLSGTGNTLAISAGGTWVSGTPNYFDLNGDTAIYKSPAIGGIASTNVFTLNAWYYLPTSVNNSVIFDVGKDFANQSAQIASGFGLGELFASGGFGYGVLEYTGAAQPGWNFISYVSTGSSSTAYLNGASIGSTTNVPSLPSDAGIIIGTALNNASPPVPRLDLAAVGRIGYFDVYNVALNPSDILDIYNLTEGSYPPVPGPTSNGVGGRQFAQGFNG